MGPSVAAITRIAPSPTGFIHLGNLYSAVADERIAHLSDGVFYLRIEDTDLKRKVDGAVDIIINVMKYFGIEFDEGAGQEDKGNNNYGPYYQRQRVEYYHVFAKELIKKGLAYPCFCTEEDNAQLREAQQAENATPGYYGKWAKCRSLTLEEIEENLKEGKPWVLRLKSPGSEDKEITIEDKIMGKISFPENTHDIVILKSDGVPTYHFAHVVDDTLMGTTLVIRGNEWLSSVPTPISSPPRPEEDDDLAPIQLVSTTTMLMAKRDIIVFFIFYIYSILYYNILTLLCLFLPFFTRLMSC